MQWNGIEHELIEVMDIGDAVSDIAGTLEGLGALEVAAAEHERDRAARDERLFVYSVTSSAAAALKQCAEAMARRCAVTAGSAEV